MPWFYKYMIREQDNGDNGGGSGDPPKDPPADPPQDTPPQQVSKSEYDKLVEQNLRLKQERDTFKEGLKSKELEQMKGQEKWKEIAELKEQEAAEIRQENESIKKALVRKEKMNAIRTAALQAGIRKEALDDLDLFDFPEVQIETTSLGNIQVHGASEAVAALKLKKPYLFGKRSGNLNGSLPEVVDGGKVTIDQLMKAEEKARKSGSPDDREAYQKLTQQFNQQRRGS